MCTLASVRSNIKLYYKYLALYFVLLLVHVSRLASGQGLGHHKSFWRAVFCSAQLDININSRLNFEVCRNAYFNGQHTHATSSRSYPSTSSSYWIPNYTGYLYPFYGCYHFHLVLQLSCSSSTGSLIDWTSTSGTNPNWPDGASLSTRWKSGVTTTFHYLCTQCSCNR